MDMQKETMQNVKLCTLDWPLGKAAFGPGPRAPTSGSAKGSGGVDMHVYETDRLWVLGNWGNRSQRRDQINPF